MGGKKKKKLAGVLYMHIKSMTKYVYNLLNFKVNGMPSDEIMLSNEE